MKVRQETATPGGSDIFLGGRPKPFWWGWGLALALTATLVVLATMPPFVALEWRMVLMQGFAKVCHQIPTRSPQIDGVPLAVCHRCYGIYWGLWIAAMAFFGLWHWEKKLNRHAPVLLLGSLVPLALDWLLGVLGWWHNTPLSRILTGGFFGVIVGLYLARALTQVWGMKVIPATVATDQRDTETG